MGANRTIIVWAIGLLAYAAPAVARDTGVGVPGYACAVSAPAAAAIAARQDSVAKRDGRIPGLGRVHGRVGWDNRKELTLVGDGFTLRRTLDPLIQTIEITLSGNLETPLVIRIGGGDGLRIARGGAVVDLSDRRSVQSALDGEAIAAFRQVIGNYERALIGRKLARRADDPHADGFLLVGAFLSSLAGDPSAMGRARDLIMQRIYGKLRAVRFEFKDCVTDYERYLLQIDTQRTQCLEAANSRDSWYGRAADRLGCEAEFMAGALAGEGQFASCTMLGAIIA
jgi:hypothetical protein